jgi:predicted dehydrogenase
VPKFGAGPAVGTKREHAVAHATETGRINVAVVGLGWWGKVIINTLKGSGKLRVATAVDLDPSAEKWALSQGLAFTADFGSVVEDPAVDAIILCTPHSAHTHQVVLAAAAKKHVFCEKPLALTYADALASVRACKSNNVVLGLGHELRFTPAMAELRRMVQSGALGTLVQSEATFTGIVSHAPENWRVSDAEAPGGPPMTGKGIHSLDLCVSMHGPAERVFASLRRSSSQATHGDTLALLLTFKSGANALITALWSSPFTNRFTVFGTKGWAEVRDKAHPQRADGWTLTTCMDDEQPRIVEYPPMSPVLANLEAFADAVAGRATYPISTADMLADIAALEAIGKSAAGEGIVEVAPIEQPDSPADRHLHLRRETA